MQYKKIPNEYFIIILDRLTRFEPAYIRYERVINDILSKYYNNNHKNLSTEEKIYHCNEIINLSVNSDINDFYLNDILTELERKYFEFNELSYQYLSARFNLYGLIQEIQKINELPINVAWLKEINKNRKDVYSLRNEKSLLFPIEKIILCEGQTEYTLLESVFKLFGFDFSKNGIKVIPAGGKNQVARKFYQMLEHVKMPFFILLDKDAEPIKELIEPKLRPIDRIYLLESGEFEDLIPRNILQKTINTVHSNELNCIWDDFNDNLSMVNNLEFIYRKYGFGEFKKAQFAQELCEYVTENCTKEDFSNSEINKILHALQE